MEKYRILTINPGSTSTKIAVFENEELIYEKTLRHSSEEIGKYEKISDQFQFRKGVIEEALKEANLKVQDLSAIVGRGGLLKPIVGGTYKVSDSMVEDLKIGVLGQHASNLGGIIARQMADEVSIPSFIVDPVVVDEMDDVARISGVPEIPRISIFHALNQKAIGRRAAKDMNKKYEDCNFLIVHMGGGVTVGAHKKGKVIDNTNGLDGEGPFSPERSGGLPVGGLMRLCYGDDLTKEEIGKRIKGNGGVVAYLGTNDIREVEEMINNGDKKAELIYDAMVYQICKEIGAYATVLKGDVDAIILTGGIAYSSSIREKIEDKVKFIAPVKAYPGEDEMIALAQGGLRVLRGEEEALVY
ncbi:butyrate kinase [Terrisporobacter sp.]|uniref:butyrate kinase n=1 Tax=Terrisporobacter sp. TaxID=1965305 RepID=UPI0026154D2B|nr:butyrate kinase [Terrisporobacter sp.]